MHTNSENQGAQMNNNDHGNRNHGRNRQSEKREWIPVASFTRADSDPNFSNQFDRRDAHIQLNQSCPQPNGYTIYSLAIDRVKEQGISFTDSDGKEGYVPPKTAQFFGIHTYVKEGVVHLTEGTIQRINDICDLYMEAAEMVREREQERFDQHNALVDAQQDRKDVRMGVQAQSTRPVRHPGKTRRENARRNGVVVDVPQGQDDQG